MSVLLATTIGSVIAAVLGTSLDTAARATAGANAAVDQQLVAAFLSRDLQSAALAPPTGTATPDRGVSIDAGPTGWSGCPSTGTLVIRFSWVSGTATETVETVETVVWTLVDQELIRRSCRDDVVVTDLVLARTVDTITATCQPDVTCRPLPSEVALRISGGSPGGEYDVELTASARTDDVAPPATGDDVGLVLLGHPTACPTLRVAPEAFVVLNTVSLVDASCGAGAVEGDASGLDVNGSLHLVDDLADPLAVWDASAASCAPSSLGLDLTGQLIVHDGPVVVAGEMALDAGVHVFCGGLELEPGALLTGEGVGVVLPTGPTVWDRVTIDLRPPSDGAWKGLAVWAADDLALVSSNVSIDGTVYVPDGALTIEGTQATTIERLVAGRLDIDAGSLLRVGLPRSPLAAENGALPIARLDEPYRATLPRITGGTAPYHYEIRVAPDWLIVSDAGELTGEPDEPAESMLQVRATDATGAALDFERPLLVSAAAPGCPDTTDGWFGEYWASAEPDGTASVCRAEEVLAFDWGLGPATDGLPADGFSARFTRLHRFDGRPTRFHLQSDGAASLTVDGVTILETPETGGEATMVRTPASGHHLVEVDYVHSSGAAHLAAGWTPPTSSACSPGSQQWVIEVFRDADAVEPETCWTTDELDVAWGTSAPSPGLPADGFVMRATRTSSVRAGTYTFELTADDTAKMFLDGIPIIDLHGPSATRSGTTRRTLPAGEHSLVVEYRDNTSDAGVRAAVLLDAVPLAPSAAAAAGDGSIAVSWVPAPRTDEPPTTGFTARASSPGRPTRSCTTDAAGRSCTITGLPNGVEHTVEVIATNRLGNSAPATISGAVTPRPALLGSADIELWLDAADPDGDDLGEEGNETCDNERSCSDVGVRLMRWNDKSTRRAHAVAPAQHQAPTYRDRSVDFDANGYLTTTADVSPDVTAFVVAQSDTDTWNTWGWLLATRELGGFVVHPWPGTSDVGFHNAPGGNSSIAARPTITDIRTPHAYHVSWQGTTTPVADVSVDGAAIATQVALAGTTRTATTISVFLGADDPRFNPGRFGDGRYREVIIIDRRLDDLERRGVLDYLARKWGLVLAPTSPAMIGASPGDGRVDVAWSAPTSDGGAPITSFTASALAAGYPTRTCTTTATTCAIDGLVNGARYLVSVQASNSVGPSTPSTAWRVVPRPDLIAGAHSVLWLDAADDSTLIGPSTGTGTAAPGQTVERWIDKSPSGNDAVQSSPTARPVRSDGLDFDGSDDLLNVTDPSRLPTGQQPSTTFAVGRYTSGFDALVMWGGGTPGTMRWFGGNEGRRYVTANGAANPTGAAWPVGTRGILVGQFEQTTGATLWADARPPTNVNGAFDTGASDARIGGSVGGQYWTGEIDEVIVVDRVVTDAERRTIEAYLARKWSVPITPDAPTVRALQPGANAVTVSWDAPTWDGGSPVTSYTVTALPGGATCASSATSCTISGLTNYTAYTFTVRANNAIGAGVPSSTSDASVPKPRITGVVFEDVDYGGGGGQPFVARATNRRRPGARVELYDGTGAFVTSTVTGSDGSYLFGGLDPDDYAVRVVTTTVTSSRAGAVPTLVPVLTYQTATTGSTVVIEPNMVGGRDPSTPDAGPADVGATLDATSGVFTAGVTGTAHALARITILGSTTELGGVSFGFNFTTVVNTNDSGQGSLRQALINANTLAGDSSLTVVGRAPGIEHIVFMIPDGTAAPGLRSSLDSFTTPGGTVDVATIRLATTLPSITAPLVLDARTQPGYPGRPVVALDGSAIVGTSSSSVLVIGGTGASRFAGFIVHSTPGRGLTMLSTGNTIAGNWIGLGPTGAAAANGNVGVLVSGTTARNNTIGGTTVADRNVISGNASFGVRIQAGATGTTVLGNFVGTDPTGTVALPNVHGIGISGSATANNTIGGTSASARNLVAGNSNLGIVLESTTSGNTIQGNWVGLDVSGAAAISAQTNGIQVQTGATGNVIGGTTAGAGNVVSGNNGTGISLNGVSANTVVGNLVGLDATGANAIPNGVDGINLANSSTGNTVGGTTAAARNVASGNGRYGIYLANAVNNQVSGNYVGLNSAGTGAVPNGATGIYLAFATTGNTIGGAAPGAGNVVSGNTNSGIGLGAPSNTASGNIIGLDASGTAAVPNGSYGITIAAAATNSVVGGPTAAERNIVSGNASQGINVDGTSGSLIQGNWVGLNLAGTAAIANGSDGVNFNSQGGTNRLIGNVISGNALRGVFLAAGPATQVIQGNIIGRDPTNTFTVANATDGINVQSSGNTIGGVLAGEANVIAGNGRSGIAVVGAAVSNRISGNSIFANAGMGIDLSASATPNGPTANDGTTTGGAPNLYLDSPVITSAIVANGALAVTGYVGTSAGQSAFANVVIEIFVADPDPTGSGEGRTYLGQLTAAGDGTFSGSILVPPGLLTSGTPVTATATDASNNTSEFGSNRTVT